MNRMFLVAALGFVAAAASSCFTGPSVGGFRPATTPHGVESRIQLRQTVVRGELLEVRDTAYVLLDESGVLLVPYSAVHEARFEGVVSYLGGAPGGVTSERLRLVSRYPHGMPAGVLQSLLAEVHQSELRVVRE